MALSMKEQEVIIIYNRIEKTATVYASDPIAIRKLDKIAEASSQIRVEINNEHSKFYVMPKTCIKIKKPPELTKKQQVALTERFNRKDIKKTPKNREKI